MRLFSERSLRSLRGVHPLLVAIARRALEITTVDFAVIEGVRSPARQAELLAAGKSWTTHSRHLVQDDGYAHAIDVMAVGDLDADGDVDPDDRRSAWDAPHYEAIKAAFFTAAAELGAELVWGGHWTKRDCPHFELASRYRR